MSLVQVAFSPASSRYGKSTVEPSISETSSTKVYLGVIFFTPRNIYPFQTLYKKPLLETEE